MPVIVYAGHPGASCMFSAGAFVDGKFTQMGERLAGPPILEIVLISLTITGTKAPEFHTSRNQEESQCLILALDRW